MIIGHGEEVVCTKDFNIGEVTIRKGFKYYGTMNQNKEFVTLDNIFHSITIKRETLDECFEKTGEKDVYPKGNL